MQIVTKDLFEMAFLLSKGMRATKAFGGREAVLLLFEGDENLGFLKTQYRQGHAEVNVKVFRKEMKQIRWFVRQFMDNCRYTNGEETMSLDLTSLPHKGGISVAKLIVQLSDTNPQPRRQNDALSRDNPTSENLRFPVLSQTVRT